jgi:hypothetical protein
VVHFVVRSDLDNFLIANERQQKWLRLGAENASFHAEKPSPRKNKSNREHQQWQILNTCFAGPSSRADRLFSFFSASLDGWYLAGRALLDEASQWKSSGHRDKA